MHSSYPHDKEDPGSSGYQENTESSADRTECVHVNVKEREHRPVLQDRELIRACLFTSQSTQTQVDPTADEQSAEEIKKEVRQHRVNICIPSVSHLPPPAPGLRVQYGKCPHSIMPSQWSRCADL